MKLVVNKELLLTKYRSEYETFDNTTGNTVAESQDLHTFHHVFKVNSTHQMQDPNMLWFEEGSVPCSILHDVNSWLNNPYFWFCL